MSAPPSYEDASAPPPSHDDLTAPFANLNIKPLPHYPDPDTCLAHLKLLFAFESLKEDVGYTDGLWGIWDTRANGKLITTENGEVREHAADEGHDSDVDDKQKFLSQIREKRWALFVARAVDRYEAWWESLGTPRPLIETDMDEIKTVAYEYFPKIEDPTFWDKKSLPPLDVLMVFHSHLLNPYNFLEDCMRRGHRQLWQSGMPWHLVNAAIDESFNYNISDDDKRRWLSQTGRSWENADDSLFKSTKCPGCQMPMNIPWTTCSLDEDSKSFQRPGLIGSGYGDGKLDYRCSSCGIRVTKELLSVAKFRRDSRHLLTKGHPMPGTILDPSKGMPEAWVRYPWKQWNYQTFANRMIKLVLRIQIQDLLKDPDLDKPPTMETVRKMIEDEVLIKQSALRVIHEGSTDARSTRKRAVPPMGRICIRKMMSRYWENFSPFALDLCGAVMRQGIFSEKMCKMDWLHSPTARETMGRLCTKYERFMKIMASYERKLVVPTLDVDLAWHTHQLSPLAYYDYTTHVTKKFIRHDDKVEDDKLSDGFEFTSKVYQESYNEPYSECTCWYCESVRASHISSIGKVFGLSKNEKIAESFYESGAANLCPPDNSAHISSHNAVRAPEEIYIAANRSQKIENRLRQLHQKRMEDNYQKACKRAEKKGRKLPPKDQYYDFWGYQYYMYGPWVYPIYLTPGMYYASDPGYSAGAGSTGAWASCAAGSCGGSVAAGGCSGGCGGGGDGGGGCGGGGGGCGGGGGGCGGGGGGGGGGGCGGGGGGT